MNDNDGGIPPLFHSAYLEGPFEKCIDCECLLNAEEQLYSVTKHFVRDEAVFEMAMCMDCSIKQREQLSSESLDAIQNYIEQNSSNTPPPEEMEGIDPELLWRKQTEQCVFCMKTRSECYQFQVMSMFMQDSMFVHPHLENGLRAPMMMCEDCHADMSKCLSKQTRESWDRFIEEHFDGPPGIEVDEPSMKPMLL